MIIYYKKIFFFLFILLSFSNVGLSKENFFDKGKKLFEAKNYDDAKFLLERSIVQDPKHANSYLYLAKIYKKKKRSKKRKKKFGDNITN